MAWLLLETAFLPSQRQDTLFILENIKKDLNEDKQSEVSKLLEKQFKNLFKTEIDDEAEVVINEYADCLKTYRKLYLDRIKTLELKAMKA